MKENSKQMNLSDKTENTFSIWDTQDNNVSSQKPKGSFRSKVELENQIYLKEDMLNRTKTR